LAAELTVCSFRSFFSRTAAEVGKDTSTAAAGASGGRLGGGTAHRWSVPAAVPQLGHFGGGA